MLKETFEYCGNKFDAYYDPTDLSGLSAIDEIVTKDQYILDKFKGLENKVFIDIGANIGIATIIMAKLNPKSTVYTFEPYIKNYKLLLENIKANNLTNVKAFNLAVSKKLDKTLTLSIFDRITGANSTHCDGKLFDKFYNITEKKEIVNCISFDNILINNNITDVHLLKIDCEGAEHDILHDSNMFKNNVVQNMVGEFHDISYISEDKFSAELLDYCRLYVKDTIKVDILHA